MLNVQRTLETRYPSFFERHRRTARTLSRFLGFLFYESRFQKFADDFPHLQGYDFVEQVLRYFDFDLRLTESERARIPSSGCDPPPAPRTPAGRQHGKRRHREECAEGHQGAPGD